MTIRTARAAVELAVGDLVVLIDAEYPTVTKAAAPTSRPWSLFEIRFYNALRLALAGEAVKLAADILAHGASFVDQEAYWAEQRGPLTDAISDSLVSIADLGASAGRAALGEIPIHVNWDLVNANATDWARQYSAQLVREIEPTTREAVRQAVADWTASGEAVPQLAERIQAMTDPFGRQPFSSARARLIAQTESTNAFASGNNIAWTAAGVAPAAFHPAAHPGCRCRLQPKRLPDGRMGMVWMTAEDERVCTSPVRVPWRADTLDGCRELNQMVVSHGDYLGQKLP